jgi:D-aminopeptidase
VTLVFPHDGDVWDEPLFAGLYPLSGVTHPTGLEWMREFGTIQSPIAITSSWCVGTVCDALIAEAVVARGPTRPFMAIPVVLETWDGILNDVQGQHVRRSDVAQATRTAASGPVSEGNVGGGTGMLCHGFKGGIGTASRVLDDSLGSYTVGVLVQTNHGHRRRLQVEGVPVGEKIPPSTVPIPREAGQMWGGLSNLYPTKARTSIIVIVATDAPLLPGQLERLAKRATLGIGRTGGVGESWSGDVAIAFSTANRQIAGEFSAATPTPGGETAGAPPSLTTSVTMLFDAFIDALFYAAVEATEEAIINALVSAETMTGRDGITVYRLPHDRLISIMTEFGRPPRPVTTQVGSGV